MIKKIISMLLVTIMVMPSTFVFATAQGIQAESIHIEPRVFVEGTNGWYKYDDDAEEYYYCYTFDFDPNDTVTFKDGTVVRGDDLNIDGEYYCIDFYDDQSYENQWTAGNTYEVTAEFMGASTTFSVTIEESPIKSFEVEPLTFIESQEVNSGNGIYDLHNNLSCIVTMKDGTVIRSNGSWLTYDGVDYIVEIWDNQSSGDPWQAGNTYEIVATLCGFSVTSPVYIEKTPIKSVEIKPVILLENTNCLTRIDETDDGEYIEVPEYVFADLIEYTVTFNDGTVASGIGKSFEHNGKEYEFDVWDYQASHNVWVGGNTYEGYAELMGFKVTFPVTIENFPIKDIEIEPVVITGDGNTDSINIYRKDEDSGEFEHRVIFLSTDNIKYTITFIDGTVLRGEGEYIEYMGEKYPIRLRYYNDEWVSGNSYESTATLLGGTVTYPLIYDVEPVIFSMEAIKNPEKSVFEKHECINPQGAVLKVNYYDYYDGTYDLVPLDRYLKSDERNTYAYLEHFGSEFWVLVSGQGEAIEKTNRYMVSFAGYCTFFEAKYNDRELQDVKVREQNEELFVTFIYNDGSEQTVKVLGIEITQRGSKYVETVDKRSGFIVTDDGIFKGDFCQNNETGEFYINIDIDDENSITSNTLGSCKWWEVRRRNDDIVRALSVYAQKTTAFDGSITKENIDELLAVACNVSKLYNDSENICGIDSDGVEFDAEKVRSAFYDLFGVMPDLELSSKYNAGKGTVKVCAMGMADSYYDVVYDVKSGNGIYDTTIFWNGLSYNISLDEAMNLVSYEISRNAGILGDANEDSKINIKDATAIQKHIANIITLTEIGEILADVNDSGNVNIKDATAIQKYIAEIETGFKIGMPIN